MRVFVIKNHKGEPYLVRLTLFTCPWFSIKLHVILRDDDDRALHDHPWPFVTIIMVNGYYEETKLSGGTSRVRYRAPWTIHYRKAQYTHRVELTDPSRPAVTFVITGRKTRKWGFHCPEGWTYWRDFDTAGGCAGD